MCSKKETQEISKEVANSFYERFLENFQITVESIIKANEHVMAPETILKFEKADKMFKKNDIDHTELSEKISSISDKIDVFLPLLQEIKKNTEARGVIRNFIKTWGGIIAGIALASWSVFKMWHNQK
jgi:hypothetical protein